MKLIAIAALLGSTQAAKLTGCTLASGKLFTDKDCKTAADPADVTAADLKTMQGIVDALDDACAAKKKVVCDASGVGTKDYTDDKCATEADKQPNFNAWGSCVKYMDGKSFVQWTDATYMKAGAAAVMAMIASQY